MFQVWRGSQSLMAVEETEQEVLWLDGGRIKLDRPSQAGDDFHVCPLCHLRPPACRWFLTNLYTSHDEELPCTHHPWTGPIVSKFGSWSTWGCGQGTGTQETFILRDTYLPFPPWKSQFPRSGQCPPLWLSCGCRKPVWARWGDCQNGHQRAVLPHTRPQGRECLCVSHVVHLSD